MVRRPTLRRQSRGFTLLLALGVVAVVTMAVMLSYSVVGREADTQADTRRQKQAFFAAEAGLAEGREAVRLLMSTATTSTLPLQATLGRPRVTLPGMGSDTYPWFELLPGTGTDGWNDYPITADTLDTSEIRTDILAGNYPEQRNVRYRVFVRDDDDDGATGFGTDSNRQLWVIAVGEVTNPNGRPTRAVVQALVANTDGQSVFTPGCISKGCGPDMNYDNPTDQNPPTDEETTTL
ncbi:hypothetical protein D7W79_37920 [Corallococcus exercitus]|uniref:Type 4 fimbrial biogenesis protein PilX N-terminal domain-containing protein n=1 Tax=Corallococcus exercitus TaxID=2316736 RepID=A0A3A8H2N6_9BACT|nr:hypothetical protein [Corallococcus exercitus]NOK39322.1 hypothetical protein [Corallococcus exercitus]RKG65377.1 hypothetical protein D7W79_37920 [Corallococcus exercitus]